MFSKNKSASFGIVLGVVFCLYLWQGTTFKQSNYEEKAQQCAQGYEDISLKIDCWMSVIEEVYTKESASAAFEQFGFTHGTYPAFANTGCHRHAHRLGDYAYYVDFMTHNDITKIYFPPESTICGYGFYHGFVEHLIQNNPTIEFANYSCQYLVKTHKNTIPGIESVCYHGAGHGFLIAQADVILDPDNATINDFTLGPLAKCESLQVNDVLRSQCREGVFNVYIDWVMEQNFNLSLNYDDPYSICSPIQNEESYGDCSIEVTRKVAGIVEHNLEDALNIIKSNTRSDLHSRMFKIAVASLIQNDPNTLPDELVYSCRTFPSPFDEVCLRAIVSGLFAHGQPGVEYQLAEQLCSDVNLIDAEKNICYEQIVTRVQYAYDSSKIESLCLKKELSNRTCALVIEN
ncbi:MAG: hypothetical protein ACI92I_000452 [Acidimicrobiales bacterium]|jgi:hypothetical protein